MRRSRFAPTFTCAALAACAPASGCRTGGAPGTVDTVVGAGEPGLGPEGAGPRNSLLDVPADLAFDALGRAYIVDSNNHRIRRWDREADVVWTLVGTGEEGLGPPGPLEGAALHHPMGVAIDPEGRLVIAVWHEHLVVRADLEAGIFEVLCGTGAVGATGDGGPCSEATFHFPVSVAFHPDGDLYIADQQNNRIRRVDAYGIVTTVAGTGLGTGLDPITGQPASPCGSAGVDCWTGDGGPAAEATLNNPVGQTAGPGGRIAFDAAGNLFVADTSNHAIRRIDGATGIIETIAGTGGASGTGGDGGPAVGALLDGPVDVEVAPNGTLFVADSGNSCIRAVAPDGVIATAGGVCGSSGYDGDGDDAPDARFDEPWGLALGPDEHLYVADTKNHVLRVLYR